MLNLVVLEVLGQLRSSATTSRVCVSTDASTVGTGAPRSGAHGSGELSDACTHSNPTHEADKRRLLVR